MIRPAFFGYGSLVNLATHSYADPVPATLKGWRRTWVGTNLRQVAFLSVIPDTDTTLKGVIAGVPNSDWAALDKREAAYVRKDVSPLVSHNGPHNETAVYQVDAPHSQRADHPILLSYLDVVVQGYADLFGEAGVAHFFETTDGWDAPISDDRGAPVYPRHQPTTTQERARVDRFLATVV